RRRHTRWPRDWSSDVCSSDLLSASSGRPSPGLSGEGRPLDADNYPKGGRVPYEPGFIRGLSAERETPASTGRVGVAGWTAPNTRSEERRVGKGGRAGGGGSRE